MANARESKASNALKNCVSDLQKAVNLISELTNKPSDSQILPSNKTNQSLFEEHKRLFSPYRPSQSSQGRQSGVSNAIRNQLTRRYEPRKVGISSNSSRKRKREVSNENKGNGNRRYLWTHRFVSLSDSEECHTPVLL